MFKSAFGVWVFLVIVLGACLGLSTTASAAAVLGNIPANRLDARIYTRPDGEFSATIPVLTTPGAKAEERQINAVTFGVFFADEVGNAYYVLQTDNTQLKYDLEKIALAKERLDAFLVGCV